MYVPQQHYKDLYKLMAAISSEGEAKKLLEDILTPQELDSLAERWQIVQELEKGTSQRDISKKLGVSISKVTRGSRAMQYGTGAFKQLLTRLDK